MNHEIQVDYIYRDEASNKYVGEIKNLSIQPVLYFVVTTKKGNFRCTLSYEMDTWCLFFPDRKKSTGLSYLEDTFWNSEAIERVLQDMDIGIRIAYAIKTIYLKNKDILDYMTCN